MCGICGSYNPHGLSAASIKPMLCSIAHRGPDDEGVWSNGRVALGNRRLSIIDLVGGHQPLSNENNTIWIAFNGEIYNYPTLREELLARGHTFKTHSDTEVVVHLYEEMGDACVTRLRGMFAFAIWDEPQQKLLLVRDYLGQKPLFYAQDGATFHFSSEIKGILSVWQRPREINWTAVHHYLSLRFIPPPDTMFCGIHKLPPAHTLVYQHGRVTTKRYWDISFANKVTLSAADYAEQLRHKLRETIKAHLISDVPVGAFLSGGMDSSMIVAVMAQDLGVDFKTFAVGVAEQDFNELPYARAVAEHHHTQHLESCVQADLIQLLPEMIWHLDEPSDPIAACQYYAAALAAEHVKVVLGGDGGDELFAGFDRYVGVGYVDHYARIPGAIRRELIGRVLAHIPENFAYKSTTQKLRWAQELAQLPTTAERYAAATLFFRFTHAEKQALFNPALWAQVKGQPSSAVIVDAYERAAATHPIERMLYADYHTRLPEHSLMLTDRMTMAHGLELRSPFLDHELVELMASYPLGQKIHKGELKHILRQLGRDYLPASILERDKQGFMFPIAYWFRETLYPFLKSYLLDSHLVREGVLQHQTVAQLIEDHHHNRIDNHVRLWMLLNLAVWHDIYIDNQPVETVQAQLKAFSPLHIVQKTTSNI